MIAYDQSDLVHQINRVYFCVTIQMIASRLASAICLTTSPAILFTIAADKLFFQLS
jgi:hypothetical protein